MRRILRAVNVGRVNSVRLGDALHSLTLTEISLLPFGGAQHVGHVQAIGALLSLLSATTSLEGAVVELLGFNGVLFTRVSELRSAALGRFRAGRAATRHWLRP